MAGLGIIIAWAGYSVMYYGITQVQGGNWGLLDLVIPGRWTVITASIVRDNGTSVAAGVTPAPSAAPSPATTQGGGLSQ